MPSNKNRKRKTRNPIAEFMNKRLRGRKFIPDKRQRILQRLEEDGVKEREKHY